MKASAVGIVLLAWSLPTHHGEFYEALGKALEAKDLASVRKLFRPTAWVDEAGGVDGRALAARLSKAEAVDRADVLEYASGPRCAVGVRFYEEGLDPPAVFWLLGERVGDEKDLRAEAWRVAQVASHAEAAREWLGRPVIRSHLEGPPLEGEDATASNPVRHMADPPEVAKKGCEPVSWHRGEKSSTGKFNAEARKKGWRCVPRRVERADDRAVVHTVLWHVEEDRYVETRYALLVGSGKSWRIYSMALSKEVADEFLEPGKEKERKKEKR